MTEPTETERAALNARLARAMGKQTCDQWECIASGFTGNAYAKRCSHQGCIAPEFWPPDFTRDPAASRELVLWLASRSNDKARVKFLNLLLFAINQRTDEQIIAAMMGGDHDAGVRRDFNLLTAPPLLIAQAADAVIGLRSQGKDELGRALDRTKRPPEGIILPPGFRLIPSTDITTDAEAAAPLPDAS